MFETSPVAVLLVNTGTPDEPTPAATRRYLAQFLSDRRVVDLPRWRWLPILHGIILRTRPRRSAARYRMIWTADGSPYRIVSLQQAARIHDELLRRGISNVHVISAMRYGNPSIADALGEFEHAGCTRIVVLPLFPQYSSAMTGSIIEEVASQLMVRKRVPETRLVTDYHDHPGYLDALAHSIRQAWTYRPGGKLLFSYHGTLREDVENGDPYERQTRATAAAVAQRLGIATDDWRVSYQCRFDKRDWLTPSTSSILERWAAQGACDVAVVSPVFATDCLETLIDCGVEQRDTWKRLAGCDARFTYVPALNASHEHISVLTDILQREMEGWIEGATTRATAQP